MRFSMFSDDPCRVMFLDSISIRLVQLGIDVYENSPGQNTPWILTKLTDRNSDNFRLFHSER